MDTPQIEGHDALRYVNTSPDNERTLIIVGDHSHKAVDIHEALSIHRINGGVKSDIDFMSINNSARGEYCAFNATLEAHNCGNNPAYPVKNIHEETMCIGLRCGCESFRVDMTLDASPVGGTSALFACIAGLWLGYKDIILCGVRMEPGTIYYDEHVRSNWELWKPVLQPHITIIGDSWVKEMYEGTMKKEKQKYEMFVDPSYYDMWCVREVGSRTFGECWHVMTEKEAEDLKKKLEDDKNGYTTNT